MLKAKLDLFLVLCYSISKVILFQPDLSFKKGIKLEMKNILQKYQYLITIFIIAAIVSIPLFWKDLDVYYDDGIQHIARAYVTYVSIINSEHTEVLSSLANGFGYSWDLFYGPFSTIMILLGKCITTTFIGGYKLTLFLGLLLSRYNNVCLCK